MMQRKYAFKIDALLSQGLVILMVLKMIIEVNKQPRAQQSGIARIYF